MTAKVLGRFQRHAIIWRRKGRISQKPYKIEILLQRNTRRNLCCEWTSCLSLPAELRSPDISLDVFKAKLKTFLFNCWLSAFGGFILILRFTNVFNYKSNKLEWPWITENKKNGALCATCSLFGTPDQATIINRYFTSVSASFNFCQKNNKSLNLIWQEVVVKMAKRASLTAEKSSPAYSKCAPCDQL